jgi:hypothetical protein
MAERVAPLLPQLRGHGGGTSSPSAHLSSLLAVQPQDQHHLNAASVVSLDIAAVS